MYAIRVGAGGGGGGGGLLFRSHLAKTKRAHFLHLVGHGLALVFLQFKN